MPLIAAAFRQYVRRRSEGLIRAVDVDLRNNSGKLMKIGRCRVTSPLDHGAGSLGGDRGHPATSKLHYCAPALFRQGGLLDMKPTLPRLSPEEPERMIAYHQF